MIGPITDGEVVVRRAGHEISILVAREDVTVVHARCAAGEQVTGPHVHHQHTDAFYVLEGELTFEIGQEAETITLTPGGFVAVPPLVAHSFRTDGDRAARWLTIHAHDGGFAAFMRGVRDGVDVEWNIAAVPANGGRPANEAVVSPGPETPNAVAGYACHCSNEPGARPPLLSTGFRNRATGTPFSDRQHDKGAQWRSRRDVTRQRERSTRSRGECSRPSRN